MKTTPKERDKMREHLKNSPKVIALIDDVEKLEELLAFALKALKTSAKQGSMLAMDAITELERMEGE